MHIRQDDLTGDRITGFLREHLENMFEITPPGSVHALGLDALRAPDITFWSVWEEDLLGCGALKELDSTSGEVKSMRTVVAHRGKGVASYVLEHILQEAGAAGLRAFVPGNRRDAGVCPGQGFVPALRVRGLWTFWRLYRRPEQRVYDERDLGVGLEGTSGQARVTA